jgi:hypothetical protein
LIIAFHQSIMASTDSITHTQEDDSTSSQGLGGSGISGEPFPMKLHQVLQDTYKRGFTSIVSWEGDRAFQVHNKESFAEVIMPVYFDSTNYKTFQRNLNLWGFRTVSKGPQKGFCSHALFVRGQPELCRSMVRVRNKTNPPEKFYKQDQGASSSSSEFEQQQQTLAVTPPVSVGATSVYSADEGESLVGSLVSAGSFFRTQGFAPALASLLQSFATGSVQSGQQQQHSLLSGNSQAVLQLIALQNQVNVLSSNNVAPLPPASSMQACLPVRCQPVQKQQQALPNYMQVQTNSNMKSASSPATTHSRGEQPSSSAFAVMDDAERRHQYARKRWQVLACRARGMAMEHNIHVRKDSSTI